MAKKDEKTEDKKNFTHPHRAWAFFKSLSGRVNFLIVLMALLYVGIGAFLAYEVKRSYPILRSGDDILAAAAEDNIMRAVIVSALLAFVIFLLVMVAGDFLIAKRARRVVRQMVRIMSGKAELESLPQGMGEFDGVTEIYRQCMLELDRVQDNIEKEIKSGIDHAELSKGLTEIQMARLEALLASMGEGVVATDTTGSISFVNRLARESLWWRDENITDVPIHDAFQLEDEKEKIISEDEWPHWPSLKEGRTVVTSAPTKPYYLRRKDNTRFPVKMTFTPVIIDNNPVGGLAVFADITDEVEFDQRKSDFISVASHQLRAPSAAIKMMTDMMRKGDFGEFSDKQMEWIEKLFKASDNMVELINQLLSISRMDAGVKMSPEATDTNEFLKEVAESSESLMMEKQQQMAKSWNDLPVLTFDRFMITEVLKNFISNAAKYSPSGGTVSLKAEADETNVKFSVADQGIGIPKSDQGQMFNKFFRAENAQRSITKGTGLGLYFVKSAVEKHGGQVGFDSVEGQGSTFWFTLPIKAAIKEHGEMTDLPDIDESGRRVESSLAH